MSTFAQRNKPWNWVIVLIWAIQLLFIPITVVLLIVLIPISSPGPNYVVDTNEKTWSAHAGVQTFNIIDLAIASAALLLTCIEIILFRGRDLSPTFYLWSSVGKLIGWAVATGLTVATIATNWDKDKYNAIYTYVAIGFTGTVCVSLILSLAYAIFISRRDHNRVNHVVDHVMDRESTMLTKYPQYS